MPNLLTSLMVAVLALTWVPLSFAEPAGMITHLSGTLSVKRTDGSSKLIAVKSEVLEGDVLVTQAETYARVKFADGGEVVLVPKTELKIQSYAYNAAKPESDNVVLNMLKGGLRAVTGLIGKRSRQKVTFLTETATIGIRGTTFGMRLVPDEPQDDSSGGGGESGGAAKGGTVGRGGSGGDAYVPFASIGGGPVSWGRAIKVASGDVDGDGVNRYLLAQLLAQTNTGGGGGGGGGQSLLLDVSVGGINIRNRAGSLDLNQGQTGRVNNANSPPVVTRNQVPVLIPQSMAKPSGSGRSVTKGVSDCVAN